MSNYCYNCAARNKCGAAVEYGSIWCIANRMASGQSKADFIGQKKADKMFCAYCGRPLKNNGWNKYCVNVNCLNRFENV